MAYEMLKAVRDKFKIKEIDTDNWCFKLFSKASFGIFLGASILCASTTYFGSPIQCIAENMDKGFMEQHCWIHGTNIIAEGHQRHIGCLSQKGKGETIGYYQWVIFILVLNAMLFVFPANIWKVLEGGLIANFNNKKDEEETNANADLIMINSESRTKILDHYINYFRILRYKVDTYFASFVCCEILNFAVLIGNFCLTNVFFGREFMTYGMDVVTYYELDEQDRELSFNPMCNLFPTRVGCEFKYIGVQAGKASVSGICILAQNIINEKTFLFIWFWYVAMMIIASLALLYRIATIAIPSVRVTILCRKIGGNRRKVRDTVIRILAQKTPGYWFMLSQIGKNTNPYFFREFILRLGELHRQANRPIDDDADEDEDVQLVPKKLRRENDPIHNGSVVGIEMRNVNEMN